MIENATVSAITAPNPADTRGNVTFPAPAPIAVRAALDDVRYSQRIALGAAIAEATAVLYVLKSQLGTAPSPTRPTRGCEVRATIDGGTLQTLIAEHVIDHEKQGGLSHYQVFLKERKP